MVFDSHKEYERYLQLCLLLRVGKIFKLDRQAVFELIRVLAYDRQQYEKGYADAKIF